MIMNKIKRKFKMWLDFILKEHKQDIENFLKEQSFDFKNYENFIEYIQFRGMINSNIKAIYRIILQKKI